MLLFGHPDHVIGDLWHRGRAFKLEFYHANYPEGVRDKLYSLQTIERGKTYMLAKSTDHDPTRFLLIYDIDWRWLREHFRVTIDQDSDVQTWLDRNA